MQPPNDPVVDSSLTSPARTRRSRHFVSSRITLYAAGILVVLSTFALSCQGSETVAPAGEPEVSEEQSTTPEAANPEVSDDQEGPAPSPPDVATPDDGAAPPEPPATPEPANDSAAAQTTTTSQGTVDTIPAEEPAISETSGVQEAVAEPAEPPPILMPDVIGLSLQQAQLAIQAAHPSAIVTVEYQKARMATGIVLDQIPAAQHPLAGDSVLLQVSERIVVTPDLIGLTQADSSAVLADAGFSNNMIHWEYRDYVGEAGLVLSQDPLPGVADPASISLTLSRPALMPDLILEDPSLARATLEDMGVQEIAIINIADATASADFISNTDPTAGQQLVSQATLTITGPPIWIPLGLLRDSVELPTSNRCTYSDAIPFEGALRSGYYCTWSDWSSRDAGDYYAHLDLYLGNNFSSMRFTFGIHDFAPNGATSMGQVRLDGAQVWEDVVQLADGGIDLVLDVADVIRAEMTARLVKDCGSDSRCDYQRHAVITDIELATTRDIATQLGVDPDTL